MPSDLDAERFSRWMSYVLRHYPARYALTPDRHGFVDLDVFLDVARRRYPEVLVARLQALIESGAHGRFELRDRRLRARYGHSIPVEPLGEPVEPPERLYHGTEPERLERILAEGLRPLGRQMIHLSLTVEDALAVAHRRTETPLVLRVEARKAHQAGVAFYCEGRVYLVAQILSQFLGVEASTA